jgi:hypothetical protein
MGIIGPHRVSGLCRGDGTGQRHKQAGEWNAEQG